MAKDYLNVIERALMMGLSDKINAAVTGDIFVHGQFPETEDMKFPSIVVQQVASGFEEQFHGEKITFGANSTAGTGDIYVYGEFPETEDLKFPAVVVQQVASGFEEQLMGQGQTFGGASGTGEIYGVAYTVHIILERETEITIGSEVYKQRRLLNWLMLNLANAVMDINWDTYQEEQLDVHERHLQTWRNIGFLEELQWYGASADFMLTFSNFRT